jgi:hypothetical protein
MPTANASVQGQAYCALALTQQSCKCPTTALKFEPTWAAVYCCVASVPSSSLYRFALPSITAPGGPRLSVCLQACTTRRYVRPKYTRATHRCICYELRLRLAVLPHSTSKVDYLTQPAQGPFASGTQAAHKSSDYVSASQKGSQAPRLPAAATYCCCCPFSAGASRETSKSFDAAALPRGPLPCAPAAAAPAPAASPCVELTARGRVDSGSRKAGRLTCRAQKAHSARFGSRCVIHR